MLLNQYIADFNNQASSVKFLSYKDVIGLTNKLKLIRSQPFHDVLPASLIEFLSNLHNVLCQMGDSKSELVENCLDIFLAIFLECKDTQPALRHQAKHFLPILIEEIGNDEDNDEKVLRLLTVIRELLKKSNDLDEHNLKLIVAALRDLTENHQNNEVLELSFEIMADLCLANGAARYLITRFIKAMSIREKMQQTRNSLIMFKFFMVLFGQDEINSNDFKYFLKLAIKEIRAGLEKFCTIALLHSSDIIIHLKRINVTIDFSIGSEEELTKLMEDLISDLSERVALDAEIPGKSRYFDKVFVFLTDLLHLDNGMINMLENFTETAFLSVDVSRTISALHYYSTYVQFGGTKATSEVVIESIIEYFTGNRQNDDDDTSSAFLKVVAVIEEKEKLSEGHLQAVNVHFDTVINQRFKVASISKLADSEINLFIHLLASLASLAKSRVIFHAKLNDVLLLDFVPLLVVKGYLSRKKDILTLLMQLSGVENFPAEKVATIWSRSSLPLSAVEPSEELCNTHQRRDSQSRSTKLINERVNKDLDLLIQKVNERLDNNDFENSTADIIEGYRQKIKFLNYQLFSISTSLEVRSAETSKQQQIIETLTKHSENQDFVNWSLQLDKEIRFKELKKLREEHALTSKTVKDFNAKLEKVEAQRRSTEKLFAVKAKEIEQINAAKAQVEQKLREAKAKLHLAQEENENRIKELKDSLETERKAKTAEHKKLQQKLTASEKDNQKLQEVITIHETQIEKQQEKIQQCESDLKEAELMKNTIMQLMQGRTSRK